MGKHDLFFVHKHKYMQAHNVELNGFLSSFFVCIWRKSKNSLISTIELELKWQFYPNIRLSSVKLMLFGQNQDYKIGELTCNNKFIQCAI